MSIDSHPARQAFKAYDIRGRVPQELTPALYERLGAAYAQVLHPQTVAVGYDIRLSSPELSAALIKGLTSQGVNVQNVGLCGTEEIYFAVGHNQLDGGLMVTASHNPADYNGLKMVLAQSRPLTAETGLTAIRDLALSEQTLAAAPKHGKVQAIDIHPAFAKYALSLIDVDAIPPIKVLCNVGNGGANAVLQCLAPHLPITMEVLHGEPDGTFPHGVPNPLLPECRQDTAAAVVASEAQLGAAWDGDFDRCFFFDEKGQFVEGYYVVALLAERFMHSHPGATIIHDPRLTWNTLEMVKRGGGNAVQSRTGHAFIKRSMREHQAVYGGEMSAHHYFSDFYFCDSGILTFLFMLELLGRAAKPLSELVVAMQQSYPISGEINSRVEEPIEIVIARLKERVRQRFGEPEREDSTDGLSWEYRDFRFNVRSSSTEPLVRLNVESRGNRQLVDDVTAYLLQAIRAQKS